MQGFRAASQEDYSIFRTRRKTSFPRFLSNRLAAAGTPPSRPIPSCPLGPGLSSAKSREPDSNFLLNPRLSLITADSLVVCIEMKCDFFAADEPFAPTGVYLLSLYLTLGLPLSTRFVPLCMRSNWMLAARPVWQPFVAHCANQK